MKTYQSSCQKNIVVHPIFWEVMKRRRQRGEPWRKDAPWQSPKGKNLHFEAEAKAKARLAREKREAFEKEQAELNQKAVREALDDVLGLDTLGHDDLKSLSNEDDEFDGFDRGSKSVGLFEKYDPSEPEVVYSDPEYGDVYYWK